MTGEEWKNLFSTFLLDSNSRSPKWQESIQCVKVAIETDVENSGTIEEKKGWL